MGVEAALTRAVDGHLWGGQHRNVHGLLICPKQKHSAHQVVVTLCYYTNVYWL